MPINKGWKYVIDVSYPILLAEIKFRKNKNFEKKKKLFILHRVLLFKIIFTINNIEVRNGTSNSKTNDQVTNH